MLRVKQPNSAKVRSILHEYASEFTSTPKGELFCKFCDCFQSEKWQKVYGGSKSLQCKASMIFVLWNWK